MRNHSRPAGHRRVQILLRRYPPPTAIDTVPSEVKAAWRDQLTHWRSGGVPSLAQWAAEIERARFWAPCYRAGRHIAPLHSYLRNPTMSGPLALISSSLVALVFALSAAHAQTPAAPPASG